MFGKQKKPPGKCFNPVHPPGAPGSDSCGRSGGKAPKRTAVLEGCCLSICLFPSAVRALGQGHGADRLCCGQSWEVQRGRGCLGKGDRGGRPCAQRGQRMAQGALGRSCQWLGDRVETLERAGGPCCPSCLGSRAGGAGPAEPGASSPRASSQVPLSA